MKNLKAMKKVLMSLGVALVFVFAHGPAAEVSFAGGRPLVLAHYLPWYQIPPEATRHNHWNIHDGPVGSGAPWNIDETLPDGRANIGSLYYPLTGPYDSRNADLLYYQAMLMKIGGLDGVIFDWRGIHDLSGSSDFLLIHEAVEAAVKAFKKAGLKFAVCYEDWIFKATGTNTTTALTRAKEDFAWLRDNLFSDPNYVKTSEGRPVLLCFGPQYFFGAEQWNSIFAGISPRPYFIDWMSAEGEGERGHDGADGTFYWTDFNPAFLNAHKELPREKLIEGMDWFYQLKDNANFLIAGAIPSFSNETLVKAGREDVDPGYRWLDYANGDTFKLTLSYAEKALPDIIQIITWNDYGEGTIIEPTIERGYAELEVLQDFRKKYDGSFAFSKADLRAPIEFYKQLAGNTAGTRKQTMEQARDAIFSGNAAAFRQYAIEAGIQYDLSVRPALRKTVAAASSEGGAVKTNKNWANAGESVTVTAIPAENYRFDTLLVKGTSGESAEIATSGSENTYTFIMPDYAVTVSAVFIRDPGTPEKKPEVPGEEPAPPSEDPEVPDNNPEKPDSGKNGGSGCDGFTPGAAFVFALYPLFRKHRR